MQNKKSKNVTLIFFAWFHNLMHFLQPDEKTTQNRLKNSIKNSLKKLQVIRSNRDFNYSVKETEKERKVASEIRRNEINKLACVQQ